jgi:hypothetical protein
MVFVALEKHQASNDRIRTMIDKIFRKRTGDFYTPVHIDPDFVESTEVITEYERGVRDGISRREALAVDVMEFTAKVERHNVDLDIENQWLRYQRTGLIILSVCFFIAFLMAVLQ